MLRQKRPLIDLSRSKRDLVSDPCGFCTVAVLGRVIPQRRAFSKGYWHKNVGALVQNLMVCSGLYLVRLTCI